MTPKKVPKKLPDFSSKSGINRDQTKGGLNRDEFRFFNFFQPDLTCAIRDESQDVTRMGHLFVFSIPLVRTL